MFQHLILTTTPWVNFSPILFLFYWLRCYICVLIPPLSLDPPDSYPHPPHSKHTMSTYLVKNVRNIIRNIKVNISSPRFSNNLPFIASPKFLHCKAESEMQDENYRKQITMKVERWGYNEEFTEERALRRGCEGSAGVPYLELIKNDSRWRNTRGNECPEDIGQHRGQ